MIVFQIAALRFHPLRNLHRFIDLGAEIWCFSGGKGIRVTPKHRHSMRKKRLESASAALQMLDMAVGSFDDWEPITSLIPKDRLKGVPEHEYWPVNEKGAGGNYRIASGHWRCLATDGFDRKAAYPRTLLQEMVSGYRVFRG